MTSSNGNIFRVTGPLCGEFTGPGEFPHKGSDAELLCFLWSAPELNDWVNNREAGDLRRYRAHYDVNVMHHELIKCLMKWFPYHWIISIVVDGKRLSHQLHFITRNIITQNITISIGKFW